MVTKEEIVIVRLNLLSYKNSTKRVFIFYFYFIENKLSKNYWSWEHLMMVYQGEMTTKMCKFVNQENMIKKNTGKYILKK